MLFAARECARVVLEEGLDKGFARHQLASAALRAGLEAMGLVLFGDARHRMANVTGVVIPKGVKDADKVRREMLEDFGIEIGTSFGPLHGKVWRLGAMGYNARPDAIYQTLAAMETVLAAEGHRFTRGAGVDAAYQTYKSS